MATYAIGDVQGCYDELGDLLQLIKFQPHHDQLWFCGDVVNRGKHSLQVLRFLTELPVKPIVTLGNHDLHLLAVAFGATEIKKQDTFQDVLEAADGLELCHWLSQQFLLHEEFGFVLCHAGILPAWDLTTAKQCAREVEKQLHASQLHREFYQKLYGNQPACWSPSLEGADRTRFIVNAFTRMRFCDDNGCLNLDFKGKPGETSAEWFPWFQAPSRKNRGLKILFGHWAALEGKVQEPGIYALDTGCVWGNQLTALRLEDEQWFSVPARL